VTGRRALRVLMVSPQFHPLQGGYERAAARISAALAERGHRVQVVTERRERAWPAVDRVDGVPVRRLPVAFRRGLHAATGSATLAAWLLPNLRRFDVLHAHSYGTPTAAAIALAALARVPVVLKLPSMGEGGIAAILAGPGPARALVRRLHRRVGACLAPSRAVRDEAVAFGIPAERVHLLPNGIDTGRHRPASPGERAAARRELGLDGGGPVVLCVAQLRPEKGVFTLLHAWERVAADLPDARLVYAGEGEERAALEAEVARSPAAASVRLAGFTDPRPWYAAADLLAIPSDFEGFSNVLLEGMSSGLPVVATRVSGTEDAFAAAELGEMVEPQDPETLAAALRRMLGDPARRAACGAAGRALAVREYSLERVVDALEEIYAGLVWPATTRRS
jgi:glycosyltransferase involved in cell wall biosynthesis